MYRFFVSDDQINIEDKKVIIKGQDVNHIKNVLRMKKGEEISVSNGNDDREFRCAISDYTDEGVECELRFIKEGSGELPVKVFLFQGLPKADKMETIIQKNVELGVFETVPVVMKRCVVKLDEKKASSKTARWQEISKAAAMQSKRGIIPEVKHPMTYTEALSYAKENCDVLLLPYEMGEDMAQTKELFNSIKKGSNIAVFIGPEGGFDVSEIEKAKEAGFKTITLGKRILRTETAGMYVMSVLGYLFEE
ncbi:MAG: 16S rRNA (uracil(1498)-N(3))-methyltransferase [Lachnospiraceae bacterium]|nr:16S rRNA (uracil(1498)-N(3))-methyltransferase [Lachnospiraceae bacterium]